MNERPQPAAAGAVSGSAAEGHIFCERCGSIAPLGGPIGASFCMGCRLFLCAECAPAGELRCTACQQSGSRAAQGIRAARDALEALFEIERDLLAIAEAHETRPAGPRDVANRSPGAAKRLEELEIKQRSAEAAIDHALRATRPQDSRRANDIRIQLTGTLAGIELAAAKVRERQEGGKATWTAMAPFGRDHRMSRNALIAVALWMAASAVVVAAVVVWGGGRSVPARIASGPNVTSGGVATGSPVATGAVAGSTPAPARTEAWSFDELRMGSSLPGGFALRAGDGAFAVAAFPNAIDRSLHLRAPDAPTTLCHRLQGIPTRIAVRVWLEGTLIRGSVLVGITTATGSRLMGAVMSDAGMVEFHGARQAVSIGRPNAAQWYDIHLRVSPNGRAAVIMEDDGGSELGRAAVNLVYPIDAQEICFALPAGEPDAELFIDDLRITY